MVKKKLGKSLEYGRNKLDIDRVENKRLGVEQSSVGMCVKM